MITRVNDAERGIGLTAAIKSANPSARLHYSAAYEYMLSASPDPAEDEGLHQQVTRAIADPGAIVGIRLPDETRSGWEARTVIRLFAKG